MPVTTEERKGISNPARVLLAYMRLTNKWDSNELSAEFGVPLRTIQRWKMECATSATDATGAISGAPSEHGHNATRATRAIPCHGTIGGSTIRVQPPEGTGVRGL